MDQAKTAARFAAFVWYLNQEPGGATPDEAAQLARENWRDFLPCADKGLCRLVGKPHKTRRQHAAMSR